MRTLPYREGNSIVIFDASLVTSPPPPQRKRLFWRPLGIFLLTLSFLGLFSLGAPIIIGELAYRLPQKENKVAVKKETFGSLLWERRAQNLLSSTGQEFSLVIPKIDLNAQIIPNVDPVNEAEYLTALKKGVAHARGTNFPGQGGLVYLFGHSTDYVFNIPYFNALFYNLKELEPGDEVGIAYQGKAFFYKVTEKKIVSGDDIAVLKEFAGQERLVLQTCWPPGTTLKRLLVIARPDIL